MTEAPVTHVLLVDDSDDDNFFHERAIARSGLVSHTRVCRDGVEAVDYLERCTRGEAQHALPKVIFLDINMPRMTGWEFLDVYADMPHEPKRRALVFMLSASMDPLDRDRARASSLVADFLPKPLTADKMRDIAREFLGADIAQ